MTWMDDRTAEDAMAEIEELERDLHRMELYHEGVCSCIDKTK